MLDESKKKTAHLQDANMDVGEGCNIIRVKKGQQLKLLNLGCLHPVVCVRSRLGVSVIDLHNQYRNINYNDA
jgi:hypothetical protein